MTIPTIAPVDRGLAVPVQAHLDDLTKPPGSLGRLEEIALWYCLATGTASPRLDHKRHVIFAADHGVAKSGVSAFPQEVTPQMVRNMLAGGAAINALTRHADADVRIVDVGVADPLDNADGLIRRKVAFGTDDIAQAPAMTDAQFQQALQAGIEQADQAATDGIHILSVGEMGIGNTTPAAAVCAALVPCDPAIAVGRGTGVDDATLEKKRAVVQQALARHSGTEVDGCAVLTSLGGFEIAAMTGLMLGAAAHRIPTVVDGFIATASALAAIRIEPSIQNYLLFAHRSAEQGHRRVFETLDIRPVLDLDMRLGEGTGAILAVTLVQAAIRTYNEMATFSSASVSKNA